MKLSYQSKFSQRVLDQTPRLLFEVFIKSIQVVIFKVLHNKV